MIKMPFETTLQWHPVIRTVMNGYGMNEEWPSTPNLSTIHTSPIAPLPFGSYQLPPSEYVILPVSH